MLHYMLSYEPLRGGAAELDGAGLPRHEVPDVRVWDDDRRAPPNRDRAARLCSYCMHLGCKSTA